ncbi:MAG: peptidylprolyl isomerase [Hellea sp.]|nr:peptidylprolyl isomerase [Hellea sp.]
MEQTKSFKFSWKNMLKSNLIISTIVFLSAVITSCGGKNPSQAQSDLPNRDTNFVVAEVNKTQIFFVDIEELAISRTLIGEGETLEFDSVIYNIVLNEAIDQRLLALKALEKKLDQEPEVIRRLAAAREFTLSDVMLEKQIKNRVNDRTIEKLYVEQKYLRGQRDEIQVRHILVEDFKVASKITMKLSEGESFDDLVSEYSKDIYTNESGGILPYFSKDMMDDEFSKLAFSLTIGEVSSPIETKDGWHIVEMLKRRRAPQPKLPEMRESIIDFMTYDEVNSLLSKLRKESTIKLNDLSEKYLERPQDITKND